MLIQIFVYKEQNVSLPYLNYYLKYPPIMEKFHNKTIRVVAILLMLSTSPLAVTYSYAESKENLEPVGTLEEPKSTTIPPEERLGAILTEKVVNGKLEVKQFSLPEDTTKEDMNRILSLEGTSGWSYVNSKIYHSGIVLFDGKASKAGENYWKISVNGTLNPFKGELDLELIEKSNAPNLGIIDNTSNGDFDYQVIFSGKVIESDEENVFTIAFMNSALKNPEISLDIKLLQFGNPTLDTVNSIDCNQKVRNSFLVI